MKIENTTRYRTADLRKFFLAGLKAEGMDPRYYQIDCVPAGGDKVHGVASYIGKWIKMSLPRGLDGQMTRLAQVFVHEIGHNQGVHHKDMMGWWNIEVPWAEGLTIREKPKLAKKPRDMQAERKAHAEKMLAEHETKLKREQRIVRKWRQKVRYYERAFEKRAANPLPREGEKR